MLRAFQLREAVASAPGPRRLDGAAGWIASLIRVRVADGARHMRQIESLTLGPKRYLHLVGCYGEQFLLAASGEGLSAPVPLRSGTHDAEPAR